MAKRAEHSAEIEAARERCFQLLLDYESFPDWQRAVRSVDVRSRDEGGRGREVEFEIDAKIKRVRYVLRYSYEPPGWIGWEYVEGDVKDVDGEFVLEQVDDGVTRATYKLTLDAGVWMPGPVQRILSDQVMKGAVEALKRRAER